MLFVGYKKVHKVNHRLSDRTPIGLAIPLAQRTASVDGLFPGWITHGANCDHVLRQIDFFPSVVPMTGFQSALSLEGTNSLRDCLMGDAGLVGDLRN